MHAFGRSSLCAVLVIVASAACGDSGAPEPFTESATAIVDGMPDTAHDGVVGIIRLGTGICTGAVLTPDLVLTARHCVSELVATGASKCVDSQSATGATVPGITLGAAWAAQLSVFTGDTLESTSPRFDVAEAFFPPDAGEGALWCGRDVALLRLAARLDGVSAVAPRLDRPAVEDEPFTAIGFGYTSAFAVDTYGVRRTNAGGWVGWVDERNPDTFAGTVDGEWAGQNADVCNGDSGGPALDTEGRVFGVASRNGGTPCAGRGIYQGLAAYAEWLREEAAKSAARLGIAPPSWVDPDSPPSEREPPAEAEPDDDEPKSPRASSPPARAAEPNGCAAAPLTGSPDDPDAAWTLTLAVAALLGALRMPPHRARITPELRGHADESLKTSRRGA